MKKNNSTKDNDDLSWDEEIVDSEDIEILSTDEEQDLYNNNKGTGQPKKANKPSKK